MTTSSGKYGINGLFVISGPCSAETEEQVIGTAVQLKETGMVDILRAGIWKPRTRPGNFEGIGAKGLPWMQQAKKLTGLPIAVEVATAKQVEDALNFDIDVLWIGARTTVNPFSVQELANALRGVNVPVFIKNPVNADLELLDRRPGTGEQSRYRKDRIDPPGFSLTAIQNSAMRRCGTWLSK